MEIRYPQVKVALVGQDGNAFMVIGLTTRALKKAGVPAEDVSEFQERCFNQPSYDALLQLIMQTVEVC